MSTTTAASIPTGTYTLDPVHSSIGFEIKHMGIATVRGSFREFEGTIDASSGVSATGVVKVASVSTGNDMRDDDLRSENFFDAEKFGEIRFESTSAEISDDGRLAVTGNLRIKDISRPITLTGTLGGVGEDPWGNQRIGAEASAVIDRREFGLRYDHTVPGGNLLVANEVKLVIEVSAIKSA